ncbi:hypothetical protein PR202_ga08418 [Eleusine coracana subsp. coracana]|uniref:Subtilisin-like protease fibronectin type-III domain-containing protein n=1 Tax=Eleusine coracana subsp. coracana TaxID=191504 RepID=A0AAV5C066_ELECO|nr:hypothetical protein PR202_ga08418 [Eleusine coracana subsp. coracana]
MTTAYNTDNAGNIIREAGFTRRVSTPFARGAGHVDPNRALDPGLVSYDDKVTQRRRVTNVARFTGGTYTLNITSPRGVRVTVNPPRLHFFRGQRRKRYEVTFEAQGEVPYKHSFGSIVWSDANHNVTSPIAVTWPDRAAGLLAI